AALGDPSNARLYSLRLLQRLVERAAHEARRSRVELNQTEARVDIPWIERDGLLEFGLDLGRILGGAEHPARLHLDAVCAGQIEVRPSALRISSDGLLQRRNCRVTVAAMQRGSTA